MPKIDESAYFELIDGRRDGPLASLMRGGLLAASWGYRTAVAARNRSFTLSSSAATRVDASVVSVGNISTGGTGKTPMVAYLVDFFRQSNLPVAILSRGYRALDDGENDEKRVLDRKCPGVPHIQNPDRIAGARQAISQSGARLLVLDDGFQHRRLARDLDIVLVDATNPWGYGHLLPRGLLREPKSALRRAHIVILTRANLVMPNERDRIWDSIGRYNQQPRIETRFEASQLVKCTGERQPIGDWTNRPAGAFSGIGNPAAFAQTLATKNFRVVHTRDFPDHYHYTADDLSAVAARTRDSGGTFLLTTLKDLVKIERTEIDGLPIWAVDIGVEFLCGQSEVTRRLNGLLEEARRA